MNNDRKKRILECGFLAMICAGSLAGIYLFSIGPVMAGALELQSAKSKFVPKPVEKAQQFYQPWWEIRSRSPAAVRSALDEYVRLWLCKS